MTPARRPSRDAQRHRPAPEVRGPSGGEYATLVMLLTFALIGTAMLISWVAERRGVAASGTLDDEGLADELGDDGTEPAG